MTEAKVDNGPLTLDEIRQNYIDNDGTGSYIQQSRYEERTYTKKDIERFNNIDGFRKMQGFEFGKTKPKEYHVPVEFDKKIDEKKFKHLSNNQSSEYVYNIGDEEKFKIRIVKDETTKNLNDNEKIIKIVYDANIDNVNKINDKDVKKQIYKDEQLAEYTKRNNGIIVDNAKDFYRSVISDYAKNNIERYQGRDNVDYRNKLLSATFNQENNTNMFGMKKSDLESNEPFAQTIRALTKLYTGSLLINSFSSERMQKYKMTYNDNGEPIKVEKVGETLERNSSSTNNLNMFGIDRKGEISSVFDDSLNVSNRLVRLATFGNKNKASYRNLVDTLGFSIDFDGVDETKIDNVIEAIDKGLLLRPTAITNSGNGLHFHYALNRPINTGKAFFGYESDHKTDRNNIIYCTKSILNILYTLILVPEVLVKTTENVKTLNIVQGFRAPGSLSKMLLPVKSYCTNSFYDIEDLVNWSLKTIKRYSNISKVLETKYNNNITQAFLNEDFDGTITNKAELRQCFDDAIKCGLINKKLLSHGSDKRILDDIELLLDSRRLRLLKFNSFTFIQDTINRIPLNKRDYIIPYNVKNYYVTKAHNDKALAEGRAEFDKIVEEHPEKFTKLTVEQTKKEKLGPEARDEFCEARKDQMLNLFLNAQKETRCIKRGSRFRALMTCSKVLKKARYTKDEAKEIISIIVNDGGYNAPDITGSCEDSAQFTDKDIDRIFKDYSDYNFARYKEDFIKSYFPQEVWDKYGYKLSAQSNEYKRKVQKARREVYEQTDEYKEAQAAKKAERAAQKAKEEAEYQQRRLERDEKLGTRLARYSNDAVNDYFKICKKCSINNLKHFTDEKGNIDIDNAIENCITLSKILKAESLADLKIRGRVSENKYLSEKSVYDIFGGFTGFCRTRAKYIVESLIYVTRKFKIHKLSPQQQQVYVNKILYKLLNDGKSLQFTKTQYKAKEAFMNTLYDGFATEGLFLSSSLLLNNTLKNNFFTALDSTSSVYSRGFYETFKLNVDQFLNKNFTDLESFNKFMSEDMVIKPCLLNDTKWFHTSSIDFLNRKIAEIHEQVGDKGVTRDNYYNKFSISMCKNAYNEKQKKLLFALIDLREDATRFSRNINWAYSVYTETIKDVYGLDPKDNLFDYTELLYAQYIKECNDEDLSEEECRIRFEEVQNKIDNDGIKELVVKGLINLSKNKATEKEVNQLLKSKIDSRKSSPFQAYVLDHCRGFSMETYNSIKTRHKDLELLPIQDDIGKALGNELQERALLTILVDSNIASAKDSFKTNWNKNKNSILSDEILNQLIFIAKRRYSNNIINVDDNAYNWAVLKYDLMEENDINKYDYSVWNELSPEETVQNYIKDGREAVKYRKEAIAQMKQQGYPAEVISIISEIIDAQIGQFREDVKRLMSMKNEFITKLSSAEEYGKTSIRISRNKYLRALTDLNIHLGAIKLLKSKAPPD